MIEKQEFYHGAALVRVIEDRRCRSIVKANSGFLVNDSAYVHLKYRTKERSPWTFQFGPDELATITKASAKHELVIVAFICGGDGICGLRWCQVKALLDPHSGWITCARKFNEQYGDVIRRDYRLNVR